MKRIVLGLLSTVLLLVMFTLGVYSQTDDASEAILAHIEPLLVNIQQRVPVSVTLAVPFKGTEIQTVTVPVELDLNLQISLASALTPVVSIAAAPSIVIDSRSPTLIPSENSTPVSSEGVQLGRVVTAEGIGEQNAPLEITDTFSASEDVIYVVAEADYIKEGTILFARWYRDGEPFEDSSEITATQNYSNTYVEFHLENLEDRIETGNYSVQLFADGIGVGTVEFTVEK